MIISKDEQKKNAGYFAAKLVQSDTVVGLGTGTTMAYVLDGIAQRIQNNELKNIVGIPTSLASKRRAQKLGIPVKNIDSVKEIDLTIDGADEVSADFQGIKGGGAAALWEKIVATYSKENVWVIDEEKWVTNLGETMPIPTEANPFGVMHMIDKLTKRGFHPTIRYSKDYPDEYVKTDSGHFVVDLNIGVVDNPHSLAAELDTYTGLLDHGLFLDTVNKVIVGQSDGTISELKAPKRKTI